MKNWKVCVVAAGMPGLERGLSHARTVAMLWVWVEPASQLLPEGHTPRPHQTDHQEALGPPAVCQLQGTKERGAVWGYSSSVMKRSGFLCAAQLTVPFSLCAARWTAAESLQKQRATSSLSWWIVLWKLWGSSPQPDPASWRCLRSASATGLHRVHFQVKANRRDTTRWGVSFCRALEMRHDWEDLRTTEALRQERLWIVTHRRDLKIHRFRAPLINAWKEAGLVKVKCLWEGLQVDISKILYSAPVFFDTLSQKTDSTDAYNVKETLWNYGNLLCRGLVLFAAFILQLPAQICICS